jgi:hypothetical protein
VPVGGGAELAVGMRRRGNVRPAGRICVLRRGKPVEADSHDAFKSSGGRYAVLFRPQSASAVNAATTADGTASTGSCRSHPMPGPAVLRDVLGQRIDLTRWPAFSPAVSAAHRLLDLIDSPAERTVNR